MPLRVFKSFIDTNITSVPAIFVFNASALSFICATYYTFVPPFFGDFYAFYALGLICLAFLTAAVAYFCLPKSPKEESKEGGASVTTYSCYFFLALGLGLFRLDRLSVWFDEDLQAKVARHLSESIVQGAAFTQMPLSYYYSALGLDLVGATEWGIRLPSALMFAGSAVLFASLVHSISHWRPLRVLATLTYIFNPWMIRYAQEGRPYACMLFFGLAWLGIVERYFLGPPEENSRNSAFLFSSTLLFLLSIAFQSAMVLAAVFFVILFIRERQTIQAIAPRFFSITTFSFALSLPLVGLAAGQSSKYLRFSLLAEGASETPVPYDIFLAKVPSMLGSIWFFSIGAFFLLGCFLFSLWRSNSTLTKSEGVSLGLASICLGFMFVSCITFAILVKFPWSPRYSLFLIPLLILALTAICQQVYGSSRFTGILRHKLLLLWIGMVGLLATEIRELPAVFDSYAYDRFNPDYRAMYRYFRKEGKPGDVGYVIPFGPKGWWLESAFVSCHFYYRDNFPVQVTDIWERGLNKLTPDIVTGDFSSKSPQQVFFVLHDVILKMDGIDVDAIPAEGRLLWQNGISVFKVKVRESLPLTVKNFLVQLKRLARKNENTFGLSPLFADLARYQKATLD